jgi:GNAT superfamily N-acetyltransferase
MEIFQARVDHLDEVSNLFDQYRVFYNSTSDIQAAKEFLKARFEVGDSVIFAAKKEGSLIGFTQLYPSFSSVSMKRVWILNDLFVEQAHRNQGVARLLLKTVENFARDTESARIILSTQVTNIAAQALYESIGYSVNKDFFHYSFGL